MLNFGLLFKRKDYKNMLTKSGCLFVLLVLLSMLLEAQTTYSSKQALEIFRNKDYVEAEKAYSYLLSKYDREPKYNYYYGICLLQLNKNTSEAVKRLKYASVKGVSRDAYYYLGRAYQLSYEFDEAISQYERFLKYASSSDIRNERAELYIKQSEVGRRYSSKVYHLDVFRRDTLLYSELLDFYHPVSDVGSVTRNKDFFEAGVDPEGVLYLTERGDEVYFSMKDDQSGQRDLFKMEKLLDGWGDSRALAAINSDEDDIHPFLQIDGVTLFFTSNRNGGLGGYDIYRTEYDTQSKSFSEPVNMGIPFNSPKDDYLFVSDEFNNTAWFASNRETNDSVLMVYQIKWDDSVVKNLVSDMNEVKEVAALHLTDADFKVLTKNGQSANRKSSIKEEVSFSYMIADTLVYSDLSHFKSDEAKALFKSGQQLSYQKDSLSMLMAGKRERYALTSSATERDMLVNDILSLEKQVYGIDGEIEQSFNNARIVEVRRINELVRQGRYTAPNQVKIKQKSRSDLSEILIPDEFTFYTDEAFKRRLDELELMYGALFSQEEINELKRADSLYVWGNILTLESSILLENASNQPSQMVPVVSSPFKKRDSINEDKLLAEGMIAKSKELKLTALKAYHGSLDMKFRIYRSKITGVSTAQPTLDFTFIDVPQTAANGYFRQANEMLNPMLGFDMERYEKAGAFKRSGVQEQEGALFMYVDFLKDGKMPVESEPSTEEISKPQKTYQELQGNVVEPNHAIKEPTNKNRKIGYEYRIQIGVFRNEPNSDALSKIPTITKVDIEGKDLTKYFSGSYASYNEASKQLSKVREGGFKGAFVVVFKDGRQVNLTDELKN